MYAQCPDCRTVFSLDASALAQARGGVICGNCETLFDALDTLADQLPPEPFRLLAENRRSEEAPRLELAIYRPREDVPVAAEPPPAAPAFTPRFAHERRAPRQRARRWPWVLTCALLTLLLAAQVAWAKRDLLVADPAIGTWLRQACASLGCKLPLVRDVHRLHLVARDVQAHPSVPGALMISATVRNDAPFAQPYPVVTMILSDADGHRVAMRRLHPTDYLDDNAALRAGLAPGASAALLIEVADPGTRAVAFEFGFE
ncbi:zinc-ribbon and DUF3426 domain-containing protein [Frateuria sp. STR12]|uniref:zinc-ribbon and DUF3426 domain-containing protein n=1 Tax=Frateuria hangzhouensis TaxID=2995589 RepID=UPI002260A085|nr:zinc-ribbon and DUF3426 domain-containing protein [Frateuria sp. STR12]MCX7514476.1 zinc-ribbon and DUF3426 domain-containing protein [Frateuria sp. STR12]